MTRSLIKLTCVFALAGFMAIPSASAFPKLSGPGSLKVNAGQPSRIDLQDRRVREPVLMTIGHRPHLFDGQFSCEASDRLPYARGRVFHPAPASGWEHLER